MKKKLENDAQINIELPAKYKKAFFDLCKNKNSDASKVLRSYILRYIKNHTQTGEPNDKPNDN